MDSVREQLVMIVEDETLVRELMVMILRSSGFQNIFHVADSREALEVAEREQQLGLVIIDMHLPEGVNGAEIAEKIRGLHPEAKLLLVSGDAGAFKDAIPKLGSSAAGLAKPFTMTQMRNSVNALLPG